MRKYQRKQSHKKKNLMVSIQLVIRNGLLFFANKFGYLMDETTLYSTIY